MKNENLNTFNFRFQRTVILRLQARKIYQNFANNFKGKHRKKVLYGFRSTKEYNRVCENQIAVWIYVSGILIILILLPL